MDINFELRHPGGGIELIFNGMNWDLHNFADFVGCHYDKKAGTFSMKWVSPSGCENPWGDPANSSRSCELLFEGVSEVQKSPGKGHLSRDSETLMKVAKAIPKEYEFPNKVDWEVGEPFDLEFVFEDQSEIRVVASSCRLIGGCIV